MSWPRGRSRSGCSATSASSSTTSSAWRPSSSSASIRSSMRGEAELVESRDLGLREVRVAELRERRAAPERERLPQLLGRRARARHPLARAARLLERVAEDVGIELAALEAKAVSVAVRLERATAEPSVPRSRETSACSVFSADGGRRLAPEPVDQPVRRHDLVRVEQQDREELALLPARDLDALALDDDFERAQDPCLHRAPRSWCSRLCWICSRSATTRRHGAPDRSHEAVDDGRRTHEAHRVPRGSGGSVRPRRDHWRDRRQPSRQPPDARPRRRGARAAGRRRPP